jgi:hypothetical protein
MTIQNFRLENGLQVTGSEQIQGALSVSSGITGTLHGTASYGQDSNLLDGLDSTAFARLAAANTFTTNQIISGNLSVTGQVSASFVTASQGFVNGGLVVGNYLQMLPVGALNIPTNLTASYIYTSGSTNDMYFTQYQGPYTNTTRLRWLESTLSTGLLHGGVISTVNGTTTFTVSSGSGLIVNYNASTGSDPYPTINFVSWPTRVSQSLLYSGSAQITYIAIDSNGEISQETLAPNFSEYKDRIVLGRVLHQSASVTNGSINTPPTAYGLATSTADFIRAIGPLKVNGHYLAASGSGNLSLTKSAGDSYVEGRNYSSNPNIPNVVLAADDTAVTVSKIYRQRVSGGAPVIDTGVAGAGYTVLDPAKYQDSNGNLASVGNSDFTVQRVYWFPKSVNKALYVYYGQTKYATMTEAIDGINTEFFTEGNNTRTSAILVGYVLLKGNANTLTDPNQGRIYQAGLFRGGAGGGGGASAGGGSTTLNGLTDVSLGSPVTGEALIYDSSISKWKEGYPNSASYATNAATASYVVNAATASYVNTLSQNVTVSGNMIVTGSLYVTGGALYTNNYLSTSSGVKIGTTVDSGSVDPVFGILQVVAGTGSNETTLIKVHGSKAVTPEYYYTGILEIAQPAVNQPAISIGKYGSVFSGYQGGINWGQGWDGGVYFGPYSSDAMKYRSTNRRLSFETIADAFLSTNYFPSIQFASTQNTAYSTRPAIMFYSDNAYSGTKVVTIGVGASGSAVTGSAKMLTVKTGIDNSYASVNNESEKAYINAQGDIWASGSVLASLISGSVVTGSTVTGSTATFTTVTGSNITGSGAGLYNLTASGISNFANDTRNQFTAGNNIGISAGVVSLSSSVSTAAVSGTAGISGTLGLFTVVTGTTATGSTALYTAITGSTVTGSTALFTTITGSNITGSGAGLYNLTASGMSNFTTDVRGQFTAGSNIGISAGAVSLNSTVITAVVSGTTGISGALGLFTVVTGTTATGSTALYTAITGTAVSGTTVTFTNITGSHSGSGAGLYNLTASGISNFTSDVRGQFTAGSNIGISAGAVSLNSTVITAVVSGTTGISGGLGLFTVVTGSTVTGSTALFTTITGSNITGSGAGLYNLTASGISNFTSDVRGQFTAGNNIGISAGVVSLSSSVSTAVVSGTTGLSGALGLFTVVTGTTITGSTALYTTITGSTITGSTALHTVVTGTTVTGSTALFTTITGSTALFTTITGSTITGSTALYIVITGTTTTGTLATFSTVTGSTGLSGALGLFTNLTGTNISGATLQYTNITGSSAYVSDSVSIGATSPATKLEVFGPHVSALGLLKLSSSANIAAATFYPAGTYAGAVYGDTDGSMRMGTNGASSIVLYTNGTSNRRMTIDSAGLTTVSGNVRLGRTDASQEGGEIQFNQSVNDSVKWYIDTYGSTDATADLRFFDNTGSVVMRLNAGTKTVEVYSGIKFPASQVASSDVNTLDDYEEGFWTPAFSASTTTNFTYSSATSGSYVKIGKNVSANGYIVLTSTGSSAGNIYIQNLPFAIGAGNANYYPLNVGYHANISATLTSPVGYGALGSTTIVLDKNNTGSVAPMGVTDITNTTVLVFGINYNIS